MQELVYCRLNPGLLVLFQIVLDVLSLGVFAPDVA